MADQILSERTRFDAKAVWAILTVVLVAGGMIGNLRLKVNSLENKLESVQQRVVSIDVRTASLESVGAMRSELVQVKEEVRSLRTLLDQWMMRAR